MKPITTGAGLALALSALLGFGNLADAQEPKSKPAAHCIEFFHEPDPFFWQIKNKCRKLFIIAEGFGANRKGIPRRRRGMIIPPGGSIDTNPNFYSYMPVWGAACEVSMATIASEEKRRRVVVNLDLDAGTFSCGKNGKFGSGKAIFAAPHTD